ncbi:MAG: PAS domain S-box protein [Geobacteraceae bacterium]|nr:PAS domain S-box protein [Geobacteraceae bacterium]NTW81587.1 PAS domain S-box protein [Geobacteraceae bacterium]
MHLSTKFANRQYQPMHIFLIVVFAILVSESAAVVMIAGIRDPWEELLEVVLLTILISIMIYFLLIRPLIAEIALRSSAETGLRAERERMEQVTSAIGAGLAVIDRNYKIIWTNRILSQSFRSVEGSHCYNAFKQCDAGPCDECGVREVFETGRQLRPSEHRLVDAQGRIGWFQVIVTPLQDKDGSTQSALELLVPIDDRKAVEDDLIYNQKRFQSLVESSVDWVWEVDANGCYSYSGPQCKTLLGYDPEEILGMTPFMLMPPDDAERISSLFNEIAAEQRSFVLFENCLVHKDGRIVVTETSGTPFLDKDNSFCGYRGIARDISNRRMLEIELNNYQNHLEQQVQEQTIELQQLLAEQKQNISELQSAEASLRQSESRFRQIFEQNGDAIILFDLDSGAVCDANPAAQVMFEGVHDALLGISWDYLNVRDEFSTSLKLSDICCHGDFLLKRGEMTNLAGKALIVSIWAKLLQLKDRRIVYCTLHDITEKTRLMKDAQEIQSKLIQTNKMTSLGFLVAGIAHEINNPNNNILLSAQLLNNIWKDVLPILERRFMEEGDFVLGGEFFSTVRDSIPTIFNMITDGSRRIEIIINNLRDFTVKSKSEMMQTVDINKAVSISASILQHQIKKHTRNFSLSLSSEPLTIKGNLQQMEQVIVNLIVNAIQALPSEDRAVRVATTYDPSLKSVAIAVSDEGCGIPQEHLAYILDPFFSTKLETGGTGLGLSISNHIIKEHGGRLEFQSTAGRGTTVTVILPVTSPPQRRISNGTIDTSCSDTADTAC